MRVVSDEMILSLGAAGTADDVAARTLRRAKQCSKNNLQRDGDSNKSHHALVQQPHPARGDEGEV
jgi:hypothetical protein